MWNCVFRFITADRWPLPTVNTTACKGFMNWSQTRTRPQVSDLFSATCAPCLDCGASAATWPRCTTVRASTTAQKSRWNGLNQLSFCPGDYASGRKPAELVQMAILTLCSQVLNSSAGHLVLTGLMITHTGAYNYKGISVLTQVETLHALWKWSVNAKLFSWTLLKKLKQSC